MGKKYNTEFLEAYINLDSACTKAFGISRGGIGEYINRLRDNPLAPSRDEVLKKLIGYRKKRNRLAHEEGAISDTDDIDKSDIRWLKDFCKAMQKGKDPLSLTRQALPIKKFLLLGAATLISVLAIALIIIIAKQQLF